MYIIISFFLKRNAFADNLGFILKPFGELELKFETATSNRRLLRLLTA